MPTLPSDKVDRKRLPPRPPRSATEPAETSRPTPTPNGTREALADLHDLTGCPRTAHFFEDLGANSLLWPTPARARSTPTCPRWPSADVPASDRGGPGRRRSSRTARARERGRRRDRPTRGAVQRPGAYAGGGALPAADCSSPIPTFILLVRPGGYRWAAGARDSWRILGTHRRLRAFTFALLAPLPVLAKWLLVGRWKVTEMPVWSLAYLRFWLVKTLIIANPLGCSSGTPSTRSTCGRWGPASARACRSFAARYRCAATC